LPSGSLPDGCLAFHPDEEVRILAYRILLLMAPQQDQMPTCGLSRIGKDIPERTVDPGYRRKQLWQTRLDASSGGSTGTATT